MDKRGLIQEKINHNEDGGQPLTPGQEIEIRWHKAELEVENGIAGIREMLPILAAELGQPDINAFVFEDGRGEDFDAQRVWMFDPKTHTIVTKLERNSLADSAMDPRIMHELKAQVNRDVRAHYKACTTQ